MTTEAAVASVAGVTVAVVVVAAVVVAADSAEAVALVDRAAAVAVPVDRAAAAAHLAVVSFPIYLSKRPSLRTAFFYWLTGTNRHQFFARHALQLAASGIDVASSRLA